MTIRLHDLQRRTLVDTGAWFATIHSKDHNYAVAHAIGSRLHAEHWTLVTTNYIVAETHALLLTRVNRATAARALQDVDDSLTEIVRVSVADEQRAREIIRQYDDKNFSLTDATSFAVMERLGIVHAFTFDRNFAQYGWTILTP